MPDTNNIVNKLGTTKRSASGDFIPELSFSFRNAFSNFLGIMNDKNIRKEEPAFNIQFKEQFPALLKEQLRALYYKFTVGRYNYLNPISYDEFLNLVMPFMVTTDGASFYNNFSSIVKQAGEAVQKKLPTPKQEAMNKEKALKVKVLIEKLLIETKIDSLKKEHIKEKFATQLTRTGIVQLYLKDTNPEHIYHEPQSNEVIVILGEYEGGSSELFEEINNLEQILGEQEGYTFITVPGDDCPSTLIVRELADLSDLKEVRSLYQNIWYLSTDNEEDEGFDENETDSMDGEQEINEDLKEWSSPGSLKDEDLPRPSKMTRPDISGMTKNAKAYWDLYIQDEAEEILVDKYGRERGHKTFEGLLNIPRFGGFYQATTEIVMQKAKMYQDLGERPPSDYFSESWFSVWKRWMKSQGKSFKIANVNNPDNAPVLTKPTVQTPILPPSKTKPVPYYNDKGKVNTSTSSNSYDSKDEMRINDILTKANGDRNKAKQLAQLMANKITDKSKALRRANAAEDNNCHDLANIFLKRAMQL